MGVCWPDDKRVKIPTVAGYTFYSCNHCPLDACASVIPQVVLTYKDFDRALAWQTLRSDPPVTPHKETRPAKWGLLPLPGGIDLIGLPWALPISYRFRT
jgi:hypothetical protein